MDSSVFDFFENRPNRENRDEKNNRPASHSEGCDFGYEYDFEYESPESDSPRTIMSSESPVKFEGIVQQLTPDYSSSSDSDNDESLYSPSPSESSSKADSSDSIRSVFGSDSPADDSPEIFSSVQMSPLGVERQLFVFQSPVEGKGLENRFKNDETTKLKSNVSILSSKCSNVSTDTTVYTDDKETIQPRPSPSTELITFHPVNTRKVTPITHGRRATHEKGNNSKNLPPNGKILSAPQRPKPEAVDGPFVKAITLAENSGIRHLKANQPLPERAFHTDSIHLALNV
ncbi:hypothetical protein LOTGIDRAFT_167741 [Lottia gigantea]|uniref:Uncharacterized protein n=1 Tax=Lottia gigantea TaxID=225164 RepID=V3ZT76_LOTGI|nr:hypothetical protein LOTGIDRAFT_167741 [Lottia gigantea]ESO85770.1 hypothetical protein LOTGIDRAFT_167741 [Lottia gigantea]